ncbi:MAG: starch-binding protein [Ruminococcus sp.]|nr:starch-binding protein [Ruminococcus sp.]
MKMFRKLASLVIAGALLTSSLGFAATTASAAEAETESVAVDAHLQDKVDNGVILHAFNWSYNSIKESLPAIAAAGYSTVQTSPVQQPKNFGLSKDVAGQWWKLYQPVSMHIAENSWLGTKADLTSLCQEADKYGIKIIADIVVNHMGNMLETDPNSVSDEVKTYEPTFYNNRSSYFHSYRGDANDGSVQAVVQGHVSACPDVNTGNSAVQSAVLNLLKECIDCGVDGFRFDAAKHIETSNDGSYASSFWNNTLGQAKSYYSQKNGGKSLFAYGEVLNTPGSGRSYGGYTSMMRVTDNKTGDSILNAVNSRNASGAASSSYNGGLSASNVVLWAESHDTFEGNAGSGGMTNTSGVPDANVIKAWALVASRLNAPALFFARPGEALMGQVSSNNMYKSTAVSEVNKFHNLSVGKSEKLGSSGSVAYVARGTDGIVLVNCGSSTSSSVSVSGTGLANGTYTDTITGNTFTVSGGTVTGTIGATGVAVVYKGTTTPKATNSVENCSFSTDTITLKLGLENAVKGTYCIDNSTPVEFTKATNIRIGSDYKVGDTINLTLTATDSKGVTETANYKYVKSRKTATGIYVWFNAKNKSSWKAPFYVYMYDEDTVPGTVYSNGTWPGQAMKYDSKSGYYYCEVPEVCVATETATKKVTDSDFNLGTSKNTHVIFSASGDKQQYPADGAPASITNVFKMDGHSKIFALSGANSFENTTLTPYVENIEATEVVQGSGSTPTTTPVTDPVETTTQKPVTYTTYKMGDVNLDGVVSIADATAIQFMLAEMGDPFTDLQNKLGDVTGDGVVSIADATAIQFYLAELQGGENTGKEIKIPSGSQPVTQPEDKDSLYVKATSNYFPTYKYVFDKDTNKITVTYSINTSKNLVNAEWYLKYDSSVLKFNSADNKNADGGWNIMPKAADSVINASDPEDPNLISGNASSVGNPYKIQSTNGKPVDFATFTFEVLKPGKTEINLSVRNLTLGLKDNETMMLDPESEEYAVLQYDVKTTSAVTNKLTDVYAGPYVSNHTPLPQIDWKEDEDPTTNPTEPTESTSQITTNPPGIFMVKDSFNWGTANVYAWDAEGNSLTGEWPGTTQVSATSYNGANAFAISVPDGAAGLVVNNGTAQSSDITDFSHNWQMTNQQNELGHYLVTSWDPIPSNPTDYSDPIPTNPSGTFKLTDNFGWGSASVYAWNADNEAILGEWPGTAVTETETNDLGENVFIINVPEGAIGVVVSSGEAQTADITNFAPGGGGYWMNGTQNELGHYNLTEWGSGPGPDPVPGEGIKFTDNQRWGNVNMYAWDADGNALLGDWPGTPMTPIGDNDFGEPVFQGAVPQNAVGVVFNQGMDGDQTEDVTNLGVEGYYTDGTRDGNGHLVAKPWGEPIPGPDPVPGEGIKFTDNQRWGNVNMYAWDADGNALLGDWPGTPMTSIGDNDFGEPVYQGAVPENAVGVVFNQGMDGDQTVDVTDLTVEGYYTDGTRDGSGHLNALPWGNVPPVQEGKEILFTNNYGWGSVYCYMWNDTTDNGWPGVKMESAGTNDFGEPQFKVTVPADMTNIIFSDGGSAQTVDIPFDSSATGYYLTGWSDGKATVGTW